MLNIVATPIGNLYDMSFRQAKTLVASDMILAEDTRTAVNLIVRAKEMMKLDPSYELKKNPKVESYYKDVEMQKLPLVMKWLERENNVSLISEAGMPLISDPGYLLVKACIQKGFEFTVIPGPSAVTTALLYAGFKTDSFMFIGFLPKKELKLKKLIASLILIQKELPNVVFVAFESPMRIHDTLTIFDETLPNHQIVITRELTKKFEETLRGKAHELQEKEIKGEITLVIGPST
ncbi:MAG: 16S rRNA (cytidine(1402)-2'-O)-methyltransferase [Candidatus Roizmanbacteria bacterium]|nr:16S rRNA (cytidine(1402)-2'-O)-methyltransferase [Candidatus Roizmanbacteria bacterium]